MGIFRKKKNEDSDIKLSKLSKTQLLEILKAQKIEFDELKKNSENTIAELNEKHFSALSKAEEEYRESISRMQQENANIRAELENKIESLELKNNKLEKSASEVRFKPSEPGSVAELAFRVNCVMEVAQKAADDYVADIKKMKSEMDQEYSKYEREAKHKAEKIISQATDEAEKIRSDAQAETENIWQSLQARFDNYCDERKNSSSKVKPFIKDIG